MFGDFVDCISIISLEMGINSLYISVDGLKGIDNVRFNVTTVFLVQWNVSDFQDYC